MSEVTSYGEFNLSRSGFEHFVYSEIDVVTRELESQDDFDVLTDALIRTNCLLMAKKLAGCEPPPGVNFQQDFSHGFRLLRDVSFTCSKPVVDVVDSYGPFEIHGMKMYPRLQGVLMSHYFLMAISGGVLAPEAFGTTVINWLNPASRRYLLELVHDDITELSSLITIEVPVESGHEVMRVQANMSAIGAVAKQQLANLKDNGCNIPAALEARVDHLVTLNELSKKTDLTDDDMMAINRCFNHEFTVVQLEYSLMKSGFTRALKKLHLYSKVMGKLIESYTSMPRLQVGGNPWQLYSRDGECLVGPFKTSHKSEKLAALLACDDADVTFPSRGFRRSAMSPEHTIIEYFTKFIG
ncbi:hypothetical protein DICA0_F40910 [Diutina catenulata]